ncbi:MAG: hypothetical protein SVR08_06585 [Spirochaetota bacterium]|nr:hypothetical protein [Spirochaetota bacterium]
MNKYLSIFIILLTFFMLTEGCEIESDDNDEMNITITLDQISSSLQCDEIWTESDVILSISSLEATCAFNVTDELGVVWLYPASLILDFKNIKGRIKNIEVDIYDYCGQGCTTASLFNDNIELASDGNETIMMLETLNLSTDSEADKLVISSYEGKVLEIRLTN